MLQKHSLRNLLRFLPVFMALLMPPTVLGETVRNLTRTADPLEIPGESLSAILGASLESIYVSALSEGKWARVPFQIDERRRIRTESGETSLDYIFPEGTSPMVDDDPSFDADDLLVLLARDLGNQARQGIGLEVGAPAYEIEVTDPRDGSRGWAYVSVHGDGAASTGEDYVSHRPAESLLEGSRDGIDTLFSRLIIPQGAPVGMELEYMDDRRLPDPPETVSGRWGDAGYRLTGLASVGKGRYRVLLHSMIGEGYRVGGEKAFLDIMDQPLIWRCRLLPDRPASGLDPLAAAGSGRSVIREIDQEGNVDKRQQDATKGQPSAHA